MTVEEQEKSKKPIEDKARFRNEKAEKTAVPKESSAKSKKRESVQSKETTVKPARVLHADDIALKQNADGADAKKSTIQSQASLPNPKQPEPYEKESRPKNPSCSDKSTTEKSKPVNVPTEGNPQVVLFTPASALQEQPVSSIEEKPVMVSADSEQKHIPQGNEAKHVVQQELRKASDTAKKEYTPENHSISDFDSKAETQESNRPADTLREPIMFRDTHTEYFTSIPEHNGEMLEPHLFRPAQEPSNGKATKHMPRAPRMQQTVKQTKKAASKIREQINEQPDVSPSEYAEQKVEQYSRTVAHHAESSVEKMGNRLRQQTVKHLREKREEKRQADMEGEQTQAETNAQPDLEPEAADADTDAGRISEDHSYPETEPPQPDESEPEHLTYRDRPDHLRQTELAERKHPASSSMEQRGGKNHAQRQRKQSDWEKNASGYQDSGAANHGTTYFASEIHHSAVSPAQNLASGTEKEAYTATKTANNGIKTTQQAAKTTQQTAKTAQKTAKTAQQTAKSTQKSAQATARAARMAREAAIKTGQALVKAGQAVGRAFATAIKAAIQAFEGLIAAIAEGGWVAVIVIGLIAIFAVLFTSAFGVFWANETAEGKPMTEAVQRINSEYEGEISKVIQSYEKDDRYDEVKIVYKGDGDGDSASVNNWSDVLAVYSVFTTTDPDNPRDVITPMAEDEARIREIFRVMNKVSYSTKVKKEEDEDADVPKPTPDEDGNTPEPEPVMKTVLYLTITYQAMTYKEAAQYYGFDEKQMQILEEMMSPQYYVYYAAILGVDLTDGTNLTEIVSHLPANSKGAEVVKVVLTKLGSPYVLGAKGDKKFDCSGLAYWAIKQVDPELGDKMYTNAAGQARYCYNNGKTVGRSELQPGDLVFWVKLNCEGCHRWKEIHHVGIYISEGKVVEASSGHGRVIVRDLWESKNWPIYMFGRPY